jgi:protein-tyrosine phosphatase
LTTENALPDQKPDDRTGVLFVCLGNICRSPLAEGIFRHQAEARGVLGQFDIDSCGTGQWHVGERPDARAQDVARRRGIRLECIGRQLDPKRDFARFDLLVPMDRENLRTVLRHGAPADRVRLMRSFDPALRGAKEHELDVPDPYFGGPGGFDQVFDMLTAACGGLLDHLLEERPGSG